MLLQGLLLEEYAAMRYPCPGLILLGMHGDDSLGAFVMKKVYRAGPPLRMFQTQ